VEGRPSDVVVDMPLAATGRETSQLGSGRPAERLEAAIQDKRLAATEPYSSSVCDSGLVSWSFSFTYCGMPWWTGYDDRGVMVSAK
jgi:hypothetical protein